MKKKPAATAPHPSLKGTEPRKMWSGRLPVETIAKMAKLADARHRGCASQADVVALAVEKLR
jgi:hypothetical protein